MAEPTTSALGVGRHCLRITSSIEYGIALDLDAWELWLILGDAA
ncbi:hypothetical protein [Bradyrhizobium liaoningense]|nr:hypothetical protein [Bradyrhizobium liaoningense]